MNHSSGWTKCVHPETDPEDVGFQYFLVYSLSAESSLLKVMQDVDDRLKSKMLLGLVLVHPSDSTVLLDAFWDTALPSNILLCVVSHKDGQPFLDWLQEQELGKISVKVNVESSVDVPSVTMMERSSAETAEGDRSESVPVGAQHACVHICVHACVCVSQCCII